MSTYNPLYGPDPILNPPDAPPRSASKGILLETEEQIPPPTVTVDGLSQKAAEAEGGHVEGQGISKRLAGATLQGVGDPVAPPNEAVENLTRLFAKDDTKDPTVPIVDIHPDGAATVECIPSMEGLEAEESTSSPASVTRVHEAPSVDIPPSTAPSSRGDTARASPDESTLAESQTSEHTVPGEKVHLTQAERDTALPPPPESESDLASATTAAGVHPAEAKLQTEASQIPYAFSRAAALQEKFKILESPISGIPGTKENPTPTEESLSGTYRSASRSHKEMQEKILPGLAQFLMTFDPFINIAGVTAMGLAGWLIGTWGWSWIWTIMAGICLALYVIKIRTTMSRAVDFERKRNETTLHLGDNVETAEWVNFFLAQLWPIIDPALFTAAIDTLEDQFVAQAPSFITRIRIADFELGPRAPRITSLQVYPQASGEDAILMDLTVAMHPSPQEIASRTRLNTHILVEIHLGHPKLGSVTVPIMVEEAGFEAQIRVWLKMTSKAPFAKTLKFTLLNKPQLDFSIRPLKLGNIMNMPLISQFIMTVLDQTIQDMLVSPKVMALELDRLLLGDAAIADTRAIGVVKIVFRAAKHLRAADWTGTSDPYATLSFGNSTHFLCRTRIIPKDRHPVWNETHYAVITEDDVKNGFPLSVKVWDFDAMSRNDVLGQFDIRTEEVVDSDGIVFDGWKTLLRKNTTEDGKDKEEKLARNGKLNFQIGFYPKLEAKNRKEDAQKYTSGILAVQVHQALDLILRPKDRDGVYPSPYVHAYVNDQRAFSTRIKFHNPSPVWAGSNEFFIRDWKSAVFRLVVKDARQHEHDPVIGVVVLRLADVFKNTDDMVASSWYELKGGIGFGKVRMSMAFRSVKLQEERNMKGFGVGELEIKQLGIRGLDAVTKSDTPPPHICIKVRSPLTTPSKVTTHISKEATFAPTYDETFNIKVKSRYQSSLRFEVHQKGMFGFRDKVLAIGKMYLQDLVDNEERQVVLALKKWRRNKGKTDLDLEDHMGTTDKTVLAQESEKETKYVPQGEEAVKHGLATDISGNKEEGTGIASPNPHQGLDENDLAPAADGKMSPPKSPDTDSESDPNEVMIDDDSDASSTASFSMDETDSSSIHTADFESVTSVTSPELYFTAVFRPGRRWIDNPREGEDLEIDLLQPSSPSETEETTGEKDQTSKKLFTLGAATTSNVSNEKGGKKSESTREDSRLPGNKLTRTLEWSKDTVIEGVKSTRLWKRSSKKSLVNEGTEF
ncbi:uncharacterized protein SPPG_07995 [Spizellomyces punctatus DAOM BR117]|uniref:C2 domain-containing protein n=1 Tax=Spizellomyces punctatus (strain DAOM BR117) TaxID=645134 RepID=A0A0L0H5K5_SPIPD|nr:uncharacterized protein SPPG_07995 [Spizellomyces punctatus DAOM BR117]KNC96790.1 hypothetical protein SPPG_07995 [Spizellomyces punctatus DAOM BR117]|eukprot:XP_016604830.1 hypothetical protein SPPG_07995 [Spizellomyces punctatus DAOM BR117]